MSADNQTKLSKKERTKSKKDERYDDMLKKIDLGLDKQKPSSLLKADIDDDESSKDLKPGAVSILDLMSSLQNNDKTAPNHNILKTHVTELTRKTVMEEAPAMWKQEQLDRQANYDIVKKGVKKWESIIKRNREAEHLDLTQKNNNKFRINNTGQVSQLSKSALENKVEEKLKQLNLLKEEDFLKDEREMLKKLNPDEAKKRESELLKHRNLMFYQELKQKRIAKIKSKLYHRIKNKKEKKMLEKMQAGMDEADPAAQLQEIEELERKRAQERVSLRHKNKSKFVRNLFRYGDKRDSKQSVNDLTQLRKEILKKLNPEQKERLQQQMEEEADYALDDHEFKQKIIREIEEELLGEEEEGQNDGNKKKLTGFMKKLAEQNSINGKRKAEYLLEKLRNTDDLDDLAFSDNEAQGDMEVENPQGDDAKEKKKEQHPFDIGLTGRKKFKKDESTKEIGVNENKKKTKPKELKDILDSYLENADEQPEMALNDFTKGSLNLLEKSAAMEEEKPAHLGRLEPKDILLLNSSANADSKKGSSKKDKIEEEKETKNNNSANKDDLVSGLNFDTMKKKYNKSNNSQFLGDQIEKFNEENKQDLYNDLANFQVVNSNIYDEDFNKEKEDLYEDELPEEKKPLKGWGSWAGLGIKEKKVDPQIELQKKIAKIEELKKQRKDGKLDHVIMHEERNKLVTKYLVRDLPHQYKTAAQFDFVHATPLGPEWNSLKNHQKLVKPKVITKAGEIINPIQAPKNKSKKK